MEAIWVAAERRAGGTYAHSNLALVTMGKVVAKHTHDLHVMFNRTSDLAGSSVRGVAIGDESVLRGRLARLCRSKARMAVLRLPAPVRRPLAAP